MRRWHGLLGVWVLAVVLITWLMHQPPNPISWKMSFWYAGWLSLSLMLLLW